MEKNDMDKFNIVNIFKRYISDLIPKKATNVFWQLFNGIQQSLEVLEYKLNIYKRERNILTAQTKGSLRSLASMNGFEPKLKTSTKGILQIKVNPKLFNRCGYPLYITPYSVFTNKLTGLKYYYISDRTLRIDTHTLYIPVVEGEIKQITAIGTGEKIQRIYIEDDNISDGSLTLAKNENDQFTEVKSFFENDGMYNDMQFLLKFSNNTQTPLIVYVKGLNKDETLTLTYRLTSGENGNITKKMYFETESIIDGLNSQVMPNDDEIEIFNISGFDFGSDGTDVNALRAAIGYNHGVTLLFDKLSYTNFLGKFSTILLQDISLSEKHKSINNIYIGKKQSAVNETGSINDLIKRYQSIVDNKSYLLSEAEKQNLSDILNEYEFCMSSHNLFDVKINKYALQIEFETIADKNLYGQHINKMLYTEFSNFFHIKNHQINIDVLLDNFMREKNIKFNFMLFNQKTEAYKINKNVDKETEYIIKHDINGLPILKGDFDICSKIGKTEASSIKLFFDVNMVVKNPNN